MRKQLARLATLISASLTHNHVDAAALNDGDHDLNSQQMDRLDASVLNSNVSLHLAAHRSHSSHRSHGSHRSSSNSGGYSRSTPSTPTYTPPKTTKKSDPLGQEARPDGSFPKDASKMTLDQKLKNQEIRKNIIMRMQLTLQIEGYYDGGVDGIMGPKTRAAVLAYKKAKGIPGDTVLDAATLNALGIVGY